MKFGNYINQIICGDCLEVMPKFPKNSFDTIITDIPYGIGFMGKDWDTFKKNNVGRPKSYKLTYKTDYKDDVPVKRKKPELVTRDSGARRAGSYDHSRNAEYQEWCRQWSAEALRVAKPGAFLLCFGGTRTVHRLTCGLEDAGWQIRDCLMWLYGSGFPKSLNISKAIDKAKGAERIDITQVKSDLLGKREEPIADLAVKGRSKRVGEFVGSVCGEPKSRERNETDPATDLAQLWDGYGTALKPAWEPIIVGMKPLDGTFAANAEKWGVAGLNIDGGRIGMGDRRMCGTTEKSGESSYVLGAREETRTHQGRFPANVILDEEAAAMLDEQVPETSKGYGTATNGKAKGKGSLFSQGGINANRYDMGGLGASRFFYCAKASRAERNAGLEGMLLGEPPASARSKPAKGRKAPLGSPRQNYHPTVKPLKLMEYLCRLVKPPSEHPILLDPFSGSGTTLMAAINTGWDYVGIEKESEYVEIAKRRVAYIAEQEANLYGQKPLFPVEKLVGV